MIITQLLFVRKCLRPAIQPHVLLALVIAAIVAVGAPGRASDRREGTYDSLQTVCIVHPKLVQPNIFASAYKAPSIPVDDPTATQVRHNSSLKARARRMRVGPDRSFLELSYGPVSLALNAISLPHPVSRLTIPNQLDSPRFCCPITLSNRAPPPFIA